MPTNRIITGMSPVMPPISTWPFSQYASEHGIWYYLPTSDEKSPAPDCPLDFIDGDLKILSTLSKFQGCHLTPSYGGMFLSKEQSRTLWNAIKSEEKYIRRVGLKVTNVITKEIALFADSGYRVPWSSLDAFREYLETLKSGYVGILVPLSNSKLVSKFSEGYRTGLSVFDRREDSDIAGIAHALFVVEIRGQSKEEQTIEWRKFTEFVISKVLGQP